MIRRGAGILMHISSLPSEYGIGCFSETAYRFIDFLKESGQKYWQILPLGQTSYGDSPYQSFSTFAGNPYFISLEELINEGLLEKAECDGVIWQDKADKINYELIYNNRYKLLYKAYLRSGKRFSEEISLFSEENQWLSDYSLFMAIKDSYNGAPLWMWDTDIRLRRHEAVEECRKNMADKIGFYKFIQFMFSRQWKALKKYANENGVSVIGDIPIYVAADSADVWAAPELFQLNGDNIPVAVAGCPPDSFSADGQLWGNPLYNWDEHRRSGYEWWIKRLEYSFGLYDILRIDHFRGFDEYYSIPYGAKTAAVGEWKKGPGAELFDAVKNSIGEKDIIAEDLGFITPSVKKLVKDSGFMNMRVLEFAFDQRDTGNSGDYLPHNYPENSAAYTGTHDNQTLCSWYETITDDERRAVREYLQDFHTPDNELNFPLIGLLMRSRSDLTVIPIQDWLCLKDNSRMNTPSTLGNNWQFRITEEQLSRELCKKIRSLTAITDR